MKPSIRRDIRRKQRYYNKARKSRKPTDWSRFRKLQRHVLNSLKQARQDYINNILLDSLASFDTKPFWRFVKTQRQENCGVAPLKSKTSGSLLADSKSKAETLNSQFTSVFTDDDKDPYANTTIEGPSIPPIDDIIFVNDGVVKLLKTLNTKKACGPDLISCKILKELADELGPVFTSLFQQSYDTGQLPVIWRNANVAPAYKKGPVCEAANYRPISLTCITCKLIEHVVSSNIRKHLDQYGALSEFQHGFRSKFSCDTQLLVTIEDLLERNDKPKSQTDVLVLDFLKPSTSCRIKDL